MLRKLLQLVTIPYSSVLMAFGLSFLVWFLPWPSGWRTGYSIKESMNIVSLLLVLVWYLLISLFALFGHHIGQKITRVNFFKSFNKKNFYIILSIASMIGTLSSYALIIETINLNGLIQLIIQNDANLLRQALPFEAGIITLRYAAIPASAIAIINILSYQPTRISFILDYLNVILLFLTSLLASRLSILYAVTIVLGVLVHTDKSKDIKFLINKTMPIILSLVALLVFLNWTRNFNFYMTRGSLNPVISALEEAITYLGSPVQVSIGIINKNVYSYIPDLNLLANGTLNNILPSFLRSLIDSSESVQTLYYDYVDIERSLTTNSSFVEIFPSMGLFSYIYISITSLFWSVFYSHFLKYGFPINVISFSINYCFLELWRINLFNEGIFIFIIISLISSLLLSKLTLS